MRPSEIADKFGDKIFRGEHRQLHLSQHHKYYAQDQGKLTVGNGVYSNKKWLLTAYVTKSWETIPNCTSSKIKLTPQAYSHTTVLLVSSWV